MEVYKEFDKKPLIRKTSLSRKYLDYFNMRSRIDRACVLWSIDRISVQSANPIMGFAFLTGKPKIPVITSFWGSEIWGELSTYHRVLQKRLLMGSERITAITETMRSRIREKYPSLKKDIALVRYIVLSKDDYRISSQDVDDFKREFCIPEGTRVVSVSYASAPRHRHDMIMTSIGMVPREDIEGRNIWFIVPMTYGEGPWREKVKGLIGKNPYRDRISVIERDLSDKEVMIMRSITDIFINIPTQDTLSASMFEAISYGSVVITGKWLPYDELFASDVYTINIGSPDELGTCLNKTIHDIDEYKTKVRSNERYLRKIVDPARWFAVFEKGV